MEFLASFFNINWMVASWTTCEWHFPQESVMLLWVFVFVARKFHEIHQKIRSPSCRCCCEEAHLSSQNAGLSVGWLVWHFLRLLGFWKQQLGRFDPFKENKDDGRTPTPPGCRKPGLNNGKNNLSLNWCRISSINSSTVRMICWM